MARVKICEKLKLKIINDFKAGLKQKALCDKYGIKKSALSKIIKKFCETGTVKTQHLGGRPRKNNLRTKEVNKSKKSNETFPLKEEEQEEVSQWENKKDGQFLQTEWQEYTQNSQAMYLRNSNEYNAECSYPDRHSPKQSDTELHETLIPDESPYDANHEDPMSRTSVNQPSIAKHNSPTTLPPANTRLLDQTLYTLHNQIQHQTKLLEQLSQISSTMVGIMQRQVTAVEKQTEAMRRQASATEHHTLVMNNFVDMIREKMPKANSNTSTTSSPNQSNGSS